jgi:8-oxo-dGTP diphosphatase
MIQVSCAIIVKDSKILAVQHGPDSVHPYLWEFPGGKLRAGETAKQSIIREIEEELKVGIRIVLDLEPIEFAYTNKSILLIPFISVIESGEILLKEHIDLKWMNIEDWENINWLEADRQMIIRNYDFLKAFITADNHSLIH